MATIFRAGFFLFLSRAAKLAAGASWLLFAACDAGAPTSHSGPAALTLGLGRSWLSLGFGAYEAKIAYRRPFGITQLKTAGQPFNFAHKRLPIADWEWFWFGEGGGTDAATRVKLLQGGWPAPTITGEPRHTVVSFVRNIDLQGKSIDLAVDYIFYANATIEALYHIRNNSSATLTNPYGMIGFPGFSDPRKIARVQIDGDVRAPLPPFSTFAEEFGQSAAAEKKLLWRQLPRGELAPLVSKMTFATPAGQWQLTATCAPDGQITSIAAGHIVKKAYMTSHLYVTFSDILGGESRTLKVVYSMSSSPDGTKN